MSTSSADGLSLLDDSSSQSNDPWLLSCGEGAGHHAVWLAPGDKHIAVITAVITAGAEKAAIELSEVIDGLDMPGLEAPGGRSTCA